MPSTKFTPEERLNRYLQSMKKASQKYVEANKDKINEKRKQYHKNRYSNDDEYKEQRKAYSKQYYYKKKLEKQQEQEKQINNI